MNNPLRRLLGSVLVSALLVVMAAGEEALRPPLHGPTASHFNLNPRAPAQPIDVLAQFDREYANPHVDRAATRLARACSGAHDHADALTRLGASHTSHAATLAERDFLDP